ncbi:hypothetical protein GCM10007276_00060 [Agaricicola taiwanensis]|uniref:DUF72 domain-containing protein n=1 Tax=Agaricicola taiwanensis TaxID=591372 RepID=A0A8J2VKJ3_9RHOB|nr:DUF72 domain-containing protein [Agaricicola taiwanensis]GGE26915.1 hypothetical protein GCM10007276_00060 [Agaricicola taiwanensis]
MAQIRIGCSGWHYTGWRGLFYPEKMPTKDFLAYYGQCFSTTELNNPFYRLPKAQTAAAWREGTPEGFLFAWKASRYLTHLKRLKDPEEPLSRMMGVAGHLKEKLGPILVQLPPSMKVDRERLARFLGALPKGQRFTLEFRHPSWYEAEVFDLLSDHDVALCLSDHADAPAPWEVTASFVYVRGHGPGGRYYGHYSDETLKQWGDDVGRWRSGRRDVFVYFDNDQKTAAPKDARKLMDIVGGAALWTPDTLSQDPG